MRVPDVEGDTGAAGPPANALPPRKSTPKSAASANENGKARRMFLQLRSLALITCSFPASTIHVGCERGVIITITESRLFRKRFDGTADCTKDCTKVCTRT